MNIVRKATAEMIGTFALVFAGCGAVVAHALHPEAVSADAIPFVFGAVVAVMVYALGHISGAHLNPAVTLTFAVFGRFAWKEAPFYIAAQLLGAVLAIALLSATLPPAGTLGETLPGIPPLAALLWEAVLTFLLMFVIMAVATDSRAVGVMAGIAIGAMVAVGAFVGGAVTGASMNPARSIAPALLSGNTSHLWIYIVGPCIGAMLGALCYEFVRCHAHGAKSDAKGCC